jgi:hypothetical protein
VSDDELFIGWAPQSARSVRSSVGRGAVIVLAVLCLGALIAGSMRSPGEDLSRLLGGQSLVGLLEARPNAILWVVDEHDPDLVHGVLLSSQGRTAIGEAALALDGEIVRLEGNLLERAGRRGLEVGSAERASLPEASERRLRERRSEALGTLTLRGEIVDSKCYLGRMRPGAGRPHRACAQSCVGGGVPPLFLSHEGGAERHFVLESGDGGSVRLELLPFLTEPIALEGEVTRVEDLFVVRTAASRIQRL